MNLLLGAAGVVFGVGVVLWVGGAASAVLSGHPVPHGHPAGAFRAFAHPGDPSSAWQAAVGPAAVYWLVTVLVTLIVAALLVAGWRLWNHAAHRQRTDPTLLPGMASRRDVKGAAGRKALLRKASILRSSLEHPAAIDVGYRLGRSRGIDCWASVEDSAVLLGPPRSGKGLHTVINMILDAPGAVITTSTRPDNLTATLKSRSSAGRPVAVFDPQHLAPGIPATTKWSPIRGCDNPQTAMIRAKALVADPAKGVERGSFWAQQCYTAVRCLLHAAALGGRQPIDLYQWSLSPSAARNAVELLKSNPHAAPGWARALEAITAADPRQRDSTWAMVSNTFGAMADPRVLDAVSPPDGEAFDPYTFLRGHGSVYLLGTASGASATAGLVAAFVEDLVEAARRTAASSPGGRLDPPAALILDEAANYPLPSLPSLMSDGGGTNITTLVVLQSLAQARGQWGREEAEAIWDSAIVKIILGGGGNADDLRDLSSLLGTRTENRTSVSYGGPGGRSYSESREEKPILEPGQLRTLAFGHGLLLLRSAAPIMMAMTRWTDRPDARQLTCDKAELEQAILTATADR